jgi:crossover junction endodeoxyribonuclease RuvC
MENICRYCEFCFPDSELEFVCADKFYGKSIRAAFALGHVRGVILLLLNRAKIPIYEYSPREVKKSVVGNGNAHKSQVQYMLSQNLGIDLKGCGDDATDALAIAMCHYNRIRITL